MGTANTAQALEVKGSAEIFVPPARLGRRLLRFERGYNTTKVFAKHWWKADMTLLIIILCLVVLVVAALVFLRLRHRRGGVIVGANKRNGGTRR
jgi:hypothetical protein